MKATDLFWALGIWALGIGHWALGIGKEEAEVLKCLNFVSAGLASPRTLSEKQATLLASRRESHFEF